MAAILSAGAIWIGAESAHAATIKVTSTADSGPGTLRQALAAASNGDTIVIAVSGSITLASGELLVDKSVEIRGPGKDSLAIDGNGASRVFHVTRSRTVQIKGVSMVNGMAWGSYPAGAGGGVFSDHADLVLKDCAVVGNTARFGGGIFSSSFGGGTTRLALVGTTINGNSAFYGGGILNGGGLLSANPSGIATLSLTDTGVGNNWALFGGGILNDGFAGNAAAVLKNSAVTNNVVIGYGQTYVVAGGGIYNNGDSGFASLTMTDSTVSGNTAGEDYGDDPGNGGGIFNDGSASVNPGNAQLVLQNTTVSGNAARADLYDLEGRGGGIYSLGMLGSATSTLNDSVLSQNYAAKDGGGVYNIADSGNATMALTHCSVTDNVAEIILEDGFEVGSGGGFCNVGASFVDPDAHGNAQISLAHSVVGRNVSGFGGGAENRNDHADASLTVNDCEFSDNRVQSYGGAISSAGYGFTAQDSSSSIRITGSRILRNHSKFDAGGVRNYASHGLSTVTIGSSVISQNSCLGAGGGIANFGNDFGISLLSVDASTISDNHAYAGGGIYNDASYAMTLASARLTNCTLSDNSASGDHHYYGEPPEYGYAPGGGAVFNGLHDEINPNSNLVHLINCTLSGNWTQFSGGAVFNYIAQQGGILPDTLRVSLDNCTLSGSSAEAGGNAICNQSEPAEGWPLGDATVDLANTILDEGTSGDSILNLMGTVVSRGYNLCSDGAGGLLTGPGDILDTDPLLGPLQDNGGPTWTHALLFGSPAIDAGDPAFDPYAFAPPLLYDQRGAGFPRVTNGRIDIGAVETGLP